VIPLARQSMLRALTSLMRPILARIPAADMAEVPALGGLATQRSAPRRGPQ